MDYAWRSKSSMFASTLIAPFHYQFEAFWMTFLQMRLGFSWIRGMLPSCKVFKMSFQETHDNISAVPRLLNNEVRRENGGRGSLQTPGWDPELFARGARQWRIAYHRLPLSVMVVIPVPICPESAFKRLLNSIVICNLELWQRHRLRTKLLWCHCALIDMPNGLYALGWCDVKLLWLEFLPV